MRCTVGNCPAGGIIYHHACYNGWWHILYRLCEWNTKLSTQYSVLPWHTQLLIIIYLIDILKVEPSIERSDGQVQVRQLELCYSCTDVSLISINTKGGKAQAVLFQTGLVHGDGEVLIKNHGECICLDLWGGTQDRFEFIGWRGFVWFACKVSQTVKHKETKGFLFDRSIYIHCVPSVPPSIQKSRI